MTRKVDKKEDKSDSLLFVFGLDDNGKPRGARFSEVRDDIVSAALDMKCWVVNPAPQAFVAHGMNLPVGRLYASGRAFIPNIRRALYDKLFDAKGDRAAFLGDPETPKSPTNAVSQDNASATKVACVSPITSGLRTGTTSALATWSSSTKVPRTAGGSALRILIPAHVRPALEVAYKRGNAVMTYNEKDARGATEFKASYFGCGIG